jgi:EmrB/QacA subfamily drug resistance transporter
VQADLGATGAQLLWVINAYTLMLAALILVGGSLGDQLGRKRVFQSGIGLFALGSLACGLSPTSGILIAARVLQGMGASMMIPGSLAIISAHFGDERRGEAIGTWSASTTVVTVLGPLLGGFLADVGLWRGVFLINLPIAAATLLISLAKVPESHASEVDRRIDAPGAVLATLGLGGLAFGFITASELGFGATRVIGGLALGVLACAGFIVVETRTDQPMMPLALFRSRTFTGANLLTLCLYGALSVFLFFLVLNLVQVQGYRQTSAGLAVMPFAILLAALSRWSGEWVDRRGPRLPLTLGPSLTGLGFLLVGLPELTQGPSAYWSSFFPGIALFGVGMGLTVAPLSTTVMSSVPQGRAGTASGINNAASRTAGVLTVAIVGAIGLLTFSESVDRRLTDLGLGTEAVKAVRAEIPEFGAASVPREVPMALREEVQRAFDLAFVNAFRTVMFISAGLAWVGALLAGLLMERDWRANPDT